jgi:DNA-binding CsgD family transcriptional regulator
LATGTNDGLGMGDHYARWRISRSQTPFPDSCSASLDDPRLERLLLSLHGAIDVEGFWGAVQTVLNQTIPNDACEAYIKYVDFPTSWNASRILATPNACKSAEWQQGRRDASMVPAFTLSNRGIKLCRLSEVVPDQRKLRQSEFFRRYMAPHGWYYSVSCLFWDGNRLASEIVLRRTAWQGDFRSGEMALLRRLHPHIETALGRLAAVEKKATAVTTSQQDRAAVERSTQGLPDVLTVAERELVQFVRIGFSNKEIAARLDKSVRTVKTQLTSVYKKCGVRSRSRLLAMMMPRLSYD